MELLVSVTSAADARAALSGGADIIDAKNPAAGALGAVSLEQFHRIVGAVAGARPVTAALGDAAEASMLERSAHAFAAAGASFVKVGFAGVSSASRVEALLAAAVRGAVEFGRVGADPCVGPGADTRVRPYTEGCAVAQTSVIAVAYADADRAGSIAPDRLVETAAVAGARGVLLDTFDKTGGGLFDLVSPRQLAAWVAAAHDENLLVALAGKLTADDLCVVRDLGADVAGVRGAACDGGRTGHVTADRVRLLRSACDVKPAGVP
jgi:(5-formylfuran-3-yl)methyl phosphate synthase